MRVRVVTQMISLQVRRVTAARWRRAALRQGPARQPAPHRFSSCVICLRCTSHCAESLLLRSSSRSSRRSDMAAGLRSAAGHRSLQAVVAAAHVSGGGEGPGPAAGLPCWRQHDDLLSAALARSGACRALPRARTAGRGAQQHLQPCPGSRCAVGVPTRVLRGFERLRRAQNMRSVASPPSQSPAPTWVQYRDAMKGGGDWALFGPVPACRAGGRDRRPGAAMPCRLGRHQRHLHSLGSLLGLSDDSQNWRGVKTGVRQSKNRVR